MRSSRINNSESCVVCARRSDGLAVGQPRALGWYCNECGSTLAWKVLFKMVNMDKIEQDACIKVAELAGGDVSIPANELPAFIAWCVKQFAETVRSEVKHGQQS